MVTLNDLLWLSIREQYKWSATQDWTGYTREQRERAENAKGNEIFRELKARYGLR